MELSSAHSDSRPRHETCCSKICTPPAHRGPTEIPTRCVPGLENDPNFLSRVITGDESWCYGYDPESKLASSQWKTPPSPRPKKIRQVRSNVKIMLICFFDIQGIVHREFVSRGQTVNQEFYLGVLKRLKERVRRNCGDRANGSFTMTTLPHTRRCEFVNF